MKLVIFLILFNLMFMLKFAGNPDKHDSFERALASSSNK